MKFSICLVFVVLFFNTCYSQTATQGVTYERNEDKSVTFSYFKETPGSVFAILKFKQLTNASSDVVKKTIKGYGGEMVTLQPIKANENIGFSYSSRSITGNIDAKPDFKFKYVLPFKKGKEVKVRKLGYLGKRLGNTYPKNWASYQFLAKLNDTVCAVRKGVVIRIKDDAKEETDTQLEYGYRNKVSSILIEHDDGTLASYSVLKKGSFMVEHGDIVFPSTPLALAGTYDKEKNSQLRLSIYYLDEIVRNYNFNDRSKETYSNQVHLYAYVEPIFYVNSDGSGFMNLTDKETYTTISDASIIQTEMSKRERKKWLKKQRLTK